MPIRLHLTMLFLAKIPALFGGFMLGMAAYDTIRASLPDVLKEKAFVFILFGMLPAALGYYLLVILFK